MANTAHTSEAELRETWIAFHSEASPESTEEELEQQYDGLSNEYRNDVLGAVHRFWEALATSNKLEDEYDKLRGKGARLKDYPDFTGDVDDAAITNLEKRTPIQVYMSTVKAAADGINSLISALDNLYELVRLLWIQVQEDHIERELTYLEDLKAEETDKLGLLNSYTDKATRQWAGHEAEFEQAQERYRQWKQQRFGMGPSWVGAWLLYEKSGMKVTTWVRQDTAGNIVDRVVVKDEIVDNSAWTDNERYWSKLPSDPDKMIPNEVLSMYQLRPRKGADQIVRIRSWRLSTARRMTRILMEFCPFGDLYQLARWYHDTQDRIYRSNPDAYDENMKKFHRRRHKRQNLRDRVWLPEPFLWHVFESIAMAGLLMEEGDLEPDSIMPWQPVLHLDWKCQNVFLGLPSADRYRRYPLPKVGDFGLARFFDPKEKRSMEFFGAPGTAFCNAPEQILHLFPADKKRGKKARKKLRLVGPWTEVYGAGMVLWSLIEGEQGDHRLRFEDRFSGGRADFDEEKLDEPRFRKPTYDKYSEELLGLVSWCTEYNQDNRPTFREVLEQVRTFTKPKTSWGRTRGLRDMPANESAWKAEENVVTHQQDEWPLDTPLAAVTKRLIGLARVPSPPAGNGEGNKDDKNPGGQPGTELDPLPSDDGEESAEDKQADEEPDAGLPPGIVGPRPKHKIKINLKKGNAQATAVPAAANPPVPANANAASPVAAAGPVVGPAAPVVVRRNPERQAKNRDVNHAPAAAPARAKKQAGRKAAAGTKKKLAVKAAPKGKAARKRGAEEDEVMLEDEGKAKKQRRRR